MTQHVAEIVTFTLIKGTTDAAFVALSQTTEAFVRAQPGFVARWLSKGADGRWSDYVIWQDIEAATAAAAQFHDQPFCGPLMAALDKDSVQMRHEPIHWRMTA